MRKRTFLGLSLGLGVGGLTGGFSQAAPKSFAGRGEILWDSYGVPHIYGKDDAAVFYGFGWAQAQNHGDVVIHLYGEARGRAAEYWGESFADSDRWLLANDVPRRAASWYRAESAQFRANLDAFAEGINAYAKAHPDKIDPAVKVVLPVTGVDVMAHAHRLMQFIYIAPREKTLGGSNPAANAGSNAWAVAPSKSASGNAMLLANPHLPWPTSYFTYFEADLNGPGYQIYGATQVGLPVLRFAFNQRMGFTNTVNTLLGSTNYELKLADGGYVFDGKVLPFQTRQASFKIKGADGTLRTETLTIRSSVHGPVFDRPDGKTVALRVAGLDRPGGLSQYWEMGLSKSFAQFEKILRKLQVAKFNIVYADKEGHIQFLDNGILPKHDKGDLAYWNGFVPGDTSATLWTDILSYDDLPKVTDPASGFVQNANDPPWVSTWPQAIRYEDFPPYVAPNGPMSLRAQQSTHLLADKAKLSFEDFVARKHSHHTLMADRVLPDLIAAAQNDPDPEIQAAVALLKGWDRQTTGDSRAALLFETWAGKFAPNNFLVQANYKVKWSPADPIGTPSGVADPAKAVEFLKAAIVEAKAKYGAIDRPFGEVSRFAIDDVDLPGNGGFGNTGLFRTITWGPLKDGRRLPQHGETWVSMVEFSTPIKAVGLMSYGNASQPGSKHRADQLKHLSENTLRTLWTTRAEVEKNLEARTPF
ncbi:penicillin acylase family protein [Caulobacter segnis]|uniref:penicillin acylase family protein n=1 Tax=Caulobacter segnis TaxID=88688 RepID=UPI001CBBD8E4|nr:penicillin acylase family protein [Caulobacter segnis]UAL09247.1 penicillin acylase family protein [Caulobacter segnis]